MIAVALKFSLVVAVTWAVTRGARPSSAASARRLWLATLLTPLILAVLTPALFTPLSPAPWHLTMTWSVLPARVPDAAVAIYVTGAAALLIRALLEWWRAAQIVRTARPLAIDEASRLREVAGAPGLRLAESDLDGPVTAGIAVPAVLLPRGWRAMPETTLAAVLRHEAAHAQRRDPAAALTARLVHAVLWFTPAAALARREFLRFAELAADASAASSMPAREYAGALLGLAAGRRGRGLAVLEAGGRESAIARRVRLLLDDVEFGRQRPARMRVGIAATLAALLAVTAIGPAPGAGKRVDTAALPVEHAEHHAARHAARHANH